MLIARHTLTDALALLADRADYTAALTRLAISPAVAAASTAAREAYAALDETPARDHAHGLSIYDAYRIATDAFARHRLATAHTLPEITLPVRAIPLPDGAVSHGDPAPGSALWLRLRQNTLGGSDVGGIVKAGTYGHLRYDDIRARCCSPVLEDQPHEGAALAGDLWEPHLIALVGAVLDAPVYLDKNLYEIGVRHATVDGFTLTDDGALDAIVECKTATDADEWIDGPPAGYVLQVQHYIDTLGAKRGLLIVNLLDQDVMIFEVTPADTVILGPRANKAFQRPVNYADVRGYAEKMIASWIAKRLAPAAPAARRNLSLTDADREALAALPARGYVVLDTETTAHTPTRGHIIEVGAVRDDGAHFDTLYGLPEPHLAWNGTGAVEVHGITADMLDGLTPLSHDAGARAALAEFIGDRVVVAHNAAFEARWLAAYGIETTVLDTARLFGSVPCEAPNNTMRSLVEWAGGEYVDAHRAHADAAMLAAALPALLAAVAEVGAVAA